MPAPLTLNTPGRWGVNEQEKNQLLHPNWATVADSLVINDAGQLQSRGALTLVTSDGAPAEILRQFVYVNSAGTEIVISTTATKIISGIADLDDASTDITPSGAPTNGYWQFQNFNGKVVGWQAGHTPIVWSGASDFATITAASGTLPDGDCVCAAFGRLWAIDDDGQTVRYCALLDETRWDAADGGGSIDMRNVWPKGMDRVTAIAAFGGNLVIFGRRSIVIYTDGSGSATGLDPDTMYVVDTIEGTGCVARDSVQVVGEGDLLFLAEIGLQTLGRVIQSKDNPLDTISWQIADRLTAAIATEVVSATDLRTWTGHYIPQTKQYMLTHTTNEDVFVFHYGGKTQDEKGRFLVPITIWDTSVLTNIRGFITLRTGITYTTGSATHEIYKYDITASLDQGSTAIAVQFNSGWLDSEGQRNLLLKMVQITVLNPAGIDSALTLKYAADYSTVLDSLTPVDTSDESRIIFLYDPSGDIEGQYFKLGFSDTSFGRKVLTQIQAQFKPGRTAFIHKKFNDAADETFSEDATGPELAANAAIVAATVGSTTAVSVPFAGLLPSNLGVGDGVYIIATCLSSSEPATVEACYGHANGDLRVSMTALRGHGGDQTFVALQAFTDAPTDQTLRLTLTSGSVASWHVIVVPLLNVAGGDINVQEQTDTSIVEGDSLTVNLTVATGGSAILVVGLLNFVKSSYTIADDYPLLVIGNEAYEHIIDAAFAADGSGIDYTGIYVWMKTDALSGSAVSVGVTVSHIPESSTDVALVTWASELLK